MATDARTGQPIYGGSPGVGLSHVGSYQAAGTPYLTASSLEASNNKGSVARFEFPRVAKSVTVKVLTHLHAGGSGLVSEPVTVFFGESKDAGGTERVGKDVYDTNGTNAPMQYTQRHGYTLLLVSGSGAQALYGEEVTFGVRTDHINVSVNGLGGAATGSFQIYAELTNIPAARMSDSYISGSGVNTP